MKRVQFAAAAAAETMEDAEKERAVNAMREELVRGGGGVGEKGMGLRGGAAKGRCGEVGVQADMGQEQERMVAEKNRALEVRAGARKGEGFSEK